MIDTGGIISSEEIPQTNIREFFVDHCKKPGGLILVQIIDIFGDTATTALYSDYDLAWSWSRQFSEDDTIESCLFIPHFINFPEYGEVRGKLH